VHDVIYLLERVECNESEVRFVSVDTIRPEVLVEQLGTLGRVDARLAAGRPVGERASERRRARRRTGSRRHRSRRAQSLHRQGATSAPSAGRGGGGRSLVGLDAGVDGCFVAYRAPSQRRRDNASHQSLQSNDGQAT